MKSKVLKTPTPSEIKDARRLISEAGGYSNFPNEKKKKGLNNFMMIFQETVFQNYLKTDKEITGDVHRVLHHLLTISDFKNILKFKTSDVAKELCMRPSDVGRSLRVLLKKEFIFKITEGNNPDYKLNYEYCWKGETEDLEVERKARATELSEKLRSVKISVNKII